MSFAKNSIAVAISPQSEIDFLKSELEYHLDHVEEISRELSFHVLKAQATRKELEAYEGR